MAREEKSVVLGMDWRPESDISVARGPRERYRGEQPKSKDQGILIEAAESSYETGRGVKWNGYAAAGVVCYWIVDLTKRTIEVHTNPAGRGRTARYRELAAYGVDADVPVVVEGRERGKIAVKDIVS